MGSVYTTNCIRVRSVSVSEYIFAKKLLAKKLLAKKLLAKAAVVNFFPVCWRLYVEDLTANDFL